MTRILTTQYTCEICGFCDEWFSHLHEEFAHGWTHIRSIEGDTDICPKCSEKFMSKLWDLCWEDFEKEAKAQGEAEK